MKQSKPCPICAKPVPITERIGRGGRQAVYCSTSCRSKADWLRRGHKVRKPKRIDFCANCSLQFETALDHQRFCSESCRRSVIAKNQSDKWRAANPRPDGYTYKCNWCSNLIERSSPLGGKLKYHADCAEQAVSARNRRKNIKRRGVTPSAGTVEMLRQQAGDNCQLCLEPIDFVLQRTSRMGATIDHIHPISLGGTDDVSNLQLAHWICNNRKSNKVSERVNG